MLKLSDFFEVPEGVEFKFANCKDNYKIVENNLLFKTEKGSFIESLININWFVGKEIKIISSKKTISEDEKAILRNLPSEFKWIARGEDEELCVYTNKPEKSTYFYTCSVGSYENFIFFNNLFQCIKWEDEEATLIAYLLKEV